MASISPAMADSNSKNTKINTCAPCLYKTKALKKIDFKRLKTHMAESDVIYVGESHDQMEDHLAQLKALEILFEAKGKHIAVGFEMLNFTLQPVLNDYAEGKLTEAEFLKAVNWKKEWGFDFRLYKPLFDFIREKKLKALALNLPKRIVAKIARVGIEGLSPKDRKNLPKNISISKDENYLNFLKASFGAHGSTPMAKMFKFENYLASMAAWNEAMGSKMADFLNKNKKYSGLVIAGNGHMIYNAGIPASVKSRTKKLRHSSFYTEEARYCPKEPSKKVLKYADFIWFINHKTNENKISEISKEKK